MAFETRSITAVLKCCGLIATLCLLTLLVATAPAGAGEPWPGDCGSPPDPCCLIPCSSFCTSTAAKCDAGCADVDPDCCDDPCGAACSSTAAKCEAACPDVDPECCEDPCGAACMSTAAKCEADCGDVDPECCDDPCGSACSSTSAKCEAGCSDVDQACCDDPCGSACSSTAAKCEAGCSDVDQACCDDPCGSACSSNAAKCEAGCGDVDPACCEDPCGAACSDLDAKCEAQCEDLPEGCCTDGAASEEGCECPEPACSSSLFDELVCSGETLALPFTITNTLDPEADCLATFDWEISQQPPVDGPSLAPVSGTAVVAAGETVDLEALFEVPANAPAGTAHMRLDVSYEDQVLCSDPGEVEVQAPDALGALELIPQYLTCPVESFDFRVDYDVDVTNTGNCPREFTWVVAKVGGNVLLQHLPDSGTTELLQPGQTVTLPRQDFNVHPNSPSGTATLRLLLRADGVEVDSRDVVFHYEKAEVDGDVDGSAIACIGQLIDLDRSLTAGPGCTFNATWTTTKVAGNAQIQILNPVTHISFGGEGPPLVGPVQVQILPGTVDGATATLQHTVTVQGEVMWTGSSLITARIPQCTAQLASANACAGDTFDLLRQLSNTGACPSEFTWVTQQTGGTIPATITNGGSGTVHLQPGQSDNGLVSVAIDSNAGAGNSLFTLSAFDEQNQLVCQDTGQLNITPQDSWGGWVGVSTAMPAVFRETVNDVVSALPGVTLNIREASFSLEERTRDCCLAGQQVANGEIEGQGSMNFDISGRGPVSAIPFIQYDTEIDLGVVIAEIKFDLGIFWDLELLFGGSVGRRANFCTDVDCFYGGINTSMTAALSLDIDALVCIDSFWTRPACNGFTIIPAGIASTIELGLGWNLDSCSSGIDASLHLRAIQFFARFDIWYFGKMDYRRTLLGDIQVF